MEHIVFDGYSWGGIPYEIGAELSLQHWSKVEFHFKLFSIKILCLSFY